MPAVVLKSNPFVGETNRELRMLRHFVSATEFGLKAAREADHEEIRKLFDQYGEDSEIMVLMAGGSHAEMHYDEIPRALRYSQVSSIFFTVENRLVLLCDHVFDRRGDLPKRERKLRGHQFSRCQKFLSKIVDAKVTVWGDLDLARLVRNCIGHANGFPAGLEREEDQKKLCAGIEANPFLMLTDDARMIVSSDYVGHLLNVSSTLFEQSFTNLDLGGESPFDIAGLPARFGFLINTEKKDWQVMADDTDLPGMTEDAD